MIKKLINILTRKEKYYESYDGTLYKLVETWYDKDLYILNTGSFEWNDFHSELRFSDIKGILINFWINFMLSHSVSVKKKQVDMRINKLKMMKSLIE